MDDKAKGSTQAKLPTKLHCTEHTNGSTISPSQNQTETKLIQKSIRVSRKRLGLVTTKQTKALLEKHAKIRI